MTEMRGLEFGKGEGISGATGGAKMPAPWTASVAVPKGSREEIMAAVLSQEPVVDIAELEALRRETAAKYHGLIEDFKRASRRKESPLAHSLIFIDHHHPGGWVLDSPMLQSEKFTFRRQHQSEQPDGNAPSLVTIVIQDGKLSEFDPGMLSQARAWQGASAISISHSIIPRSFAVLIFDPFDDLFPVNLELAVDRYAGNEDRIISRQKECLKALQRSEEILADPNHPWRKERGNSVQSIPSDQQKLQEQIRNLGKELAREWLPVERAQVIVRERAVLCSLQDNDSLQFPGIKSGRDLGFESPLQLVQCVDEAYPAMEQMLFSGELPDEIPAGLAKLLGRE